MKKRLSLVAVVVAILLFAAAAPARAEATAETWQPGKFYATGTQLSFGGLIYQVMQAHTAQVGWEPSKVPALFIRPVPRGCKPWQVQTSYGVGSVANFGGKFFRALQPHDSLSATWTPDKATSLWDEISGGLNCPIEAKYCCTSATTGTGTVKIKGKGCVKRSDDNTGSCRADGFLSVEVICNDAQIYDAATGNLTCF